MNRPSSFFGFVILSLLLGLILAGCGFHLRGQARLPAAMNKTYLTGQLSQNQPLMVLLKQSLQDNGVTLVNVKSQASAILTIVSSHVSKRELTVSSLRKATSYELKKTVVFKVHSVEGHWSIAPQTVSVRRSYSISNSQLQSEGEEERILEKQMNRELIELILLRLQGPSHRTE